MIGNIINGIDIIFVIKIIIISLFTFYTIMKILDVNKIKRLLKLKTFTYIIIIVFLAYIVEKGFNSSVTLITLDILIAIFTSKIIKLKLGYSILITTISLIINYIVYSISAIICYAILKEIIYNDFIMLMVLIIIFSVIMKFILKIRKFKRGIIFLNINKNNDYLDILILNISATIFLAFIILTNQGFELQMAIFVCLVIFSIIMIITIQKSLQLYYKQKMLVKDLEETKAELEDKKKEVEALEKENLEFSKVSHSIAHKQKSLEHKLNELSMKSEIAEEINLKDRIDDLSKDLRKETIVVLDKTGIDEIDDMLSYMQSECVKNKIDFQLQLNGNVYKMINHYMDKEELEILLADHIKNAIIAIGYGNNINKSILVRLGKLDESYGLYVYDSGIEFEIETLINLGKKPSTTHKESGGTGMGFMNTFDTLRKHKASFIIEELGKPTKDNFTKVLKFKFDGKNEFKICSYREKEIKNKDKENSLIVEKISL